MRGISAVHRAIRRASSTRLVLAYAVLMLLAAYIIEYTNHLVPCRLCVYQRFIYMFIAAAAAIRLMVVHPNHQHWSGVVMVLLLVAEWFLSLYHLGVEMGIVSFETSCNKPLFQTPALDIESLRAQLLATPPPSCAVPAILILGYSLAAWNAFTTALLLIWLLYRTLATRHAATLIPAEKPSIANYTVHSQEK